MQQNILVFCAHSDDQVLGLGGTLAKYAKEGSEVTVVVFSFGELTHPWLKKRYSAPMRVEESKKAGAHLGCKEVLFLGLPEGKFRDAFIAKKLREKMLHLLITKKPTKVFVHTPDDLHPDHRDVYKLITGIIKSAKLSPDVYAFDVWNPIDFKKQDWPQIYVDVTETFRTKMQAVGMFKSQKVALAALTCSVLLSALLLGINHGCRFAERFYKVPL